MITRQDEMLNQNMSLKNIDMAPGDYVATLDDDALWLALYPAAKAWPLPELPTDAAECAAYRERAKRLHRRLVAYKAERPSAETDADGYDYVWEITEAE